MGGMRTRDDEDIFEEARLHVLFWTEYEGKHLVEISVFEPDDPDDPECGGTSTQSAYVTPTDARTLAAGLLKAAEMADVEIARRAKHPPKHHPVSRRKEPPPATSAPPDRQVQPTLPRVGERASVRPKKVNREGLAATLSELRGGHPPARRPAKR